MLAADPRRHRRIDLQHARGAERFGRAGRRFRLASRRVGGKNKRGERDAQSHCVACVPSHPDRG
jgi:hypothetical protein